MQNEQTSRTALVIAASLVLLHHGLIDLAIARGGSYYLTYHKFAKPEQHGDQKTLQTIKHPRLHSCRIETESVFEFELRVPREWQTDES